ncbi:MAG: 5'/3'-nucleotidase SurE [Flavobacteriales bacterium]
MKRPLILVTNDDGITAPGIQALVKAVEPLGDLLIVAPDKPQSGMGHAITVNNVLRLNKTREFSGLNAYECSGTPVDCVKLAISHVLKKTPDLIVSGINHGANYSTNVLYSGTMSAAVEGALEGIPAIGFSLLDHGYDADFTASAEIVRHITNEVLSKGLPKRICLNVNIPKITISQLKGIKICRQARAYWEDKFDCRKDQFGKDYFWLTGEFKNHDGGEDTDIWAVENNYVSVVPVHYDLTAYHALEQLNETTIDAWKPGKA